MRFPAADAVRTAPKSHEVADEESGSQDLDGACSRPPPGCQSTPVALAHLARIGRIPQEQADRLIRADRLWRTVQSMLRILVGRTTAELPSAAEGPLLRAIDGALDLSGLRATLDATAAEVRAAFTSLVGEIK